MAPPNNSSFSVSVVLPASGCDMMAKVLRFSISFSNILQSQNSKVKSQGPKTDMVFLNLSLQSSENSGSLSKK
jgi:hypothetical protein